MALNSLSSHFYEARPETDKERERKTGQRFIHPLFDFGSHSKIVSSIEERGGRYEIENPDEAVVCNLDIIDARKWKVEG